MSKEILVINESIIGSIIKDSFTFLMFAGLLYFNHKVLSGNAWIDFAFILMVLLFLIGRSQRSVFRGTKDQAIKHLKEL